MEMIIITTIIMVDGFSGLRKLENTLAKEET